MFGTNQLKNAVDGQGTCGNRVFKVISVKLQACVFLVLLPHSKRTRAFFCRVAKEQRLKL
jgi:hypothetical protein